MKILVIISYLTFFVAVAFAAGTSSNQEHTKTYLDFVSGQFTKTMFLPQTFLGQLHDYRCIVLSDNASERRREYIKILKDYGVECTGDWCVNGKFDCRQKDSRNCYNLEHIVDLRNSVADGYNKNILGNMVMAYGKWNQEMGGMKWPKVEVEKRRVYGDTIVDHAIANIIECQDARGGDATTSQEIEDIEGGIHIEFKASFGFPLLLGIACFVCVIIFLRYQGRFRHQDAPGPDPVEEISEEIAISEESGIEVDTETSDTETQEILA